MVGTWRVYWNINGSVVLGNGPIPNEPSLELFSANVRQHQSIDFYARGKLLAALLDHFHALTRIVPDITILERQVILPQNGTDALAPAAMRL